MPMWDATVHAENVAKLGELEAARNELAMKLRDQTVGATDKARSELEQVNFDRSLDHLDLLDRDIRHLAHANERMEALRPQSKEDAAKMAPEDRAFATMIAGNEPAKLPNDIALTTEEFGKFDAMEGSGRAALDQVGMRPVSGVRMTLDSDDSGSGARATTTVPKIVQALKYSGGVGPMAQHYATPTTDVIKVPRQADDSGNAGVILYDQSTGMGDEDPSNIGSVTLEAFAGVSKKMPVNRQMLMLGLGGQVEAAIYNLARRRVARLWENAFIKGTGTGTPAQVGGIEVTAKAGATAATATGFTYDNLVDLEFSVDRAYREGSEMTEYGNAAAETNGRIGFIMSDAAVGVARKLKGNGIPLWAPGILGQGAMVGGIPGTLMGYPVGVSGSMDNVATGLVPIIFGNFSYYMIRTVTSVELFVLMDTATMNTNSVQVVCITYRDAAPIAAQSGGRNTAVDAYAKLTQA